MNSFADAVFRRHYGAVYRFLLGRTRDEDRADELAQQVFADAAAALATAHPADGSALAWLYTIARRRLADEGRRRARDARLVTRLAPWAPSAPAYGSGLASVLREAVASLPFEQRAVLVSRLLIGESFAAIARALEISEPTAKMRYVRALRELRAQLERRGIEP